MKMSIKTGLFFILTFCYIVTPISGIIDLTVLWKKFYKIGKKSEQIEKICTKI